MAKRVFIVEHNGSDGYVYRNYFTSLTKAYKYIEKQDNTLMIDVPNRDQELSYTNTVKKPMSLKLAKKVATGDDGTSYWYNVYFETKVDHNGYNPTVYTLTNEIMYQQVNKAYNADMSEANSERNVIDRTFPQNGL